MWLDASFLTIAFTIHVYFSTYIFAKLHRYFLKNPEKNYNITRMGCAFLEEISIEEKSIVNRLG